MFLSYNHDNKFLKIYEPISEFFDKKKIKNHLSARLVFSSILSQIKINPQKNFKYELDHLFLDLNVSRKNITSVLKALDEINFLNFYKTAKKKWKLEIGKAQKDMIFKKFNVSSFECFDKFTFLKLNYNFLFDIVDKHERADLKSVFVLSYIKFKSLYTNLKYVTSYDVLCKFLSLCPSSLKNALKLLESKNYLKRDVNITEHFGVKQNTLTIIVFDEKTKEKIESLNSISTKGSNVDNYVDNSEKYVDNPVDKKIKFYRTPVKNKKNYLYIKDLYKDIDKKIFDDACTDGTRTSKKSSFCKKEEKEQKKSDRGGEKNTPPPENFSFYRDGVNEIGKKEKKRSILEENKGINIESSIKDLESLKKAFKTQNKQYSNKSNYKSFEDLIPSPFKEIEYEDFIYRLEKACSFKFTSNFIKKLVRKLSLKYSDYKFKDLQAIEKYFVKAIYNEKLDRDIVNCVNFAYKKEIDDLKKIFNKKDYYDE